MWICWKILPIFCFHLTCTLSKEEWPELAETTFHFTPTVVLIVLQLLLPIVPGTHTVLRDWSTVWIFKLVLFLISDVKYFWTCTEDSLYTQFILRSCCLIIWIFFFFERHFNRFNINSTHLIMAHHKSTYLWVPNILYFIFQFHYLAILEIKNKQLKAFRFLFGAAIECLVWGENNKQRKKIKAYVSVSQIKFFGYLK